MAVFFGLICFAALLVPLVAFAQTGTAEDNARKQGASLEIIEQAMTRAEKKLL
ncbi:MAG: hypothetical protein JST92_15655 [Deltaproteobacteria bacterium]|nr:hypothetical protein [Deltaproteobacteria bacterium]